MRHAPAVLLALLLLAPSAVAFTASKEPLSIAYAASGTPTMVAAGALFMDGPVAHALAIGGANGTSMDRIPSLRVIDRSRGAEASSTESGASLMIESGAMLLYLPRATSAQLATSEAYAIAVALPRAPLPVDSPPAGFVLASEAIAGTLNWTGRGDISLIPLDATITLNDARGQPLPGWDGRRVNRGADARSDPDIAEVVFVASGSFTTRIAAAVLAGATGPNGTLRLVISPAEVDRFAATKESLAGASSSLFGPDAPIAAEGGPLAVFEPFSGVLNGAILAVPNADGGQGAPPVVVSSTVGSKPFPLGQLTLVRGDDVELSWSQGQMRIQGDPTLALGRDGFAVDEPAHVGIFPIISLVLWILAAGAVVLYFVKRPPKGEVRVSLRMTSFALWAIVLLIALYFWDRSFERSFGTGIVTLLRTDGFAPDNLPRLGLVAGLELAPWSIAGLLFALPVRIAAGVGLRYLGHGKSYKGMATAAGLVSLAILGPIYALWCFNLVWAQISAALPGGS